MKKYWPIYIIIIIFLGWFFLSDGLTPAPVEAKRQTTGIQRNLGTPEGREVVFDTPVYFNFDSAELEEENKLILQQYAKLLLEKAEVNITIEGHCDERGTREYNLALGEKRAQSVRDYLVSLGVRSDRISTLSYGKEQPAVVGSNEDAWSQNRRVVLNTSN